MDSLLVTLRHARAAGLGDHGALCAQGIRGWCKRHNVDLRELCERGLPIERVEAIDDAYAQRVAAIARAERAQR